MKPRLMLVMLTCLGAYYGASAVARDGGSQDYKAYQNYDFIPGEKIVFEDDFRADTDGEFPAHWKLLKGQGVVNTLQGERVLALTEGNYATVAPRVRSEAYLADPFTVEFDFYPKAGGYEKVIAFLKSGDDTADITFGQSVSAEVLDVNLEGQYPGSDFLDHWHHAALVFKSGQLKCYLDQYRVLVVPDMGTFKPRSVSFGGIADNENPLLLRNVRIANGGDMNLVEKLTKEGRLVTHGILFDVGKSTVKAESMGTIRQIVLALKAAPSLRVEIDGHTDSDGDAGSNVTLSTARAEAVRKLLVDQGIDASRLTVKGYGAAKPIDSNATPEGKANNRRVELVRL
jgi:OmpA-OmpF porin, OOP family